MLKMINQTDKRRITFVVFASIVFIFGCVGRFGTVQNQPEAETNPIVVNPDIQPFYPEVARLNGYQGEVILRLLVSDSGRVLQSKIGRSSGYAILDESALEYAKKLQFRPAMRMGIPTGIWLIWTVNFSLETDGNAFQAMEYVRNVREWMEQSERLQGIKRARALDEIWAQHTRFKEAFRQESGTHFNSYLELFLSPSVLEMWKPYWTLWPLHFTVYQDFLLRFPDCRHAGEAKKQLASAFRDDFLHILDLEERLGTRFEMHDRFLQTASAFLRGLFPDDLEERLEPAILKRLQEVERP